MIPAMVTPMKENLELDLDRAQELADRLVKGGADSLIINGTTGESPRCSTPAKSSCSKPWLPLLTAAFPLSPTWATTARPTR